MARFVMEHRLTDPADLAGFATGGYALDAALSSADRMVFSRPWPGPAADREK
jgi:cytoplasmic iron level regulating protein YaaA (DUF328/UPF0246 family)